MKEFLEEKGFIDISKVKDFSMQLTKELSSNIKKAELVYTFVRDHIQHSADINESSLPRYASEILRSKHGICFTKSILLTAMLRAISIPSGFGYQKLILDDETAPYLILHGYTFIYLDEIEKWIKVDARGNKPGVNAQFSIETPKIAFEVRKEYDEEDENINHSYPIDSVIKCLEDNNSRIDLWKNLPVEYN